MNAMLRYTLKRILQIIPTTLGVLVLTFLLFHVVGGSPAEVVLGKNATAEALAAFDSRYGYDKPLICGRWSPVRAVPGALPLLYHLPGGTTYRLNAHRVYVDLSNTATGEKDSRCIDDPLKPAVFEVPSGWQATGLRAAGPIGKRLRLEKRNAGFFDSQFIQYMAALLHGDFGVSSEFNRPVAEILRQGVGPSLCLTVPILIGGTIVGIMLALVCAAWRGKAADRAVLVLSTVLMSVNYVVWVLVGQFIFAYRLRLFPIWGFESAAYLVLPVIIGIVSDLGRDIRFFRAAILDEIYKPYVRTAEAKGLSRSAILFRHVLRNSLIPIVTYVSLSIPFLFTGSLLLESFFGIPGLGNTSINAINSSDMAVVRAVVNLGALLYQFVNQVTDHCYAFLDPRVRLADAR